MICKVCQLKPVSLRGASTCSLTCATLLCGDNPIDVHIRLKAVIEHAKKPNVRGLKSKI